jgi:hypothetical protein
VNDRPAADAEPSPGEGGDERDELCRLLRAARERRSMTIEDIARVTRIPDHSLRRLEAGEFEDLPGDVFVRGFLRSYARCVGLDPGDVLRRYAGCGMAPAPVASDHALAAAAAVAAMPERDDGAEVVGRAAVASGAGSGSGIGSAGAGTATGSAQARGTAMGSARWPGMGSSRGTAMGSARGTGTSAEAARASMTGTAMTSAVTVTATGTGTGARPMKDTATTGHAQQARAPTASRDRRSRQRRDRQGRAASQPAARRVVPREARRARSERGGRWRPSMLAVAIAVLVVAAIAVMSHLLRRPDPRPRGGDASGSSSR